MEVDRPTQVFLARFPEPVLREAERLRSSGAVKQIFGGQSYIHARVEDGSDVYQITLRRTSSGWEWQVQGPEDQYPAGVAAVMQERIALGDRLPETPNESDGLSLTERLEEKLGRPLVPQEDVFVEKLEKRYKRYLLEQKLFDTDLVRLNPKWTVESYDPITLWPEQPKDIVEFWNYIAAAFTKKKLPTPKFMEAITQKEQTKEQMREWERQRELEAWQARMERLSAGSESAPHQGELRAMITTRDMKLQYRRTDALEGPETWAAVNGNLGFSQLREDVARGDIHLDPLSEALLMQWTNHWPDGDAPPPVLPLDSARDRAFVARLLRQPALNALVVSLDELPFQFSGEPLHWTCEEPGEDEPADVWYLQLTTADGFSVPYAMTALPGRQTLYLSDDTAYPGPPPWMDGAEAMPRCPVPREVLESAQGVEFLRKLNIALPESLRSRVMEIVMRPRLNLRLAKRGVTADSEIIFAEVTGSDDEGLRHEVLERDTWRVTETNDPEDSRVPWFDRRPLYPMAGLVEDLGLAWDHGGRQFRGRLTKTFPEKFVRWLDRLPPETELQLDEELQSLRADPVKASVRFELTDAGEIDWFDLKVLVDVEGMDLTKAQIRELVEARGGFVRMPNGGWLRLALNLTADQEAAIGHLGLDVYDLSGETHRMHVLQLAEPRAGEIFDPEAWNRITDRASRLKLQVRPPVPTGFQLQLRPYQIEGFHFLAYLSANNFGGVLADDMGLGKTAQSICWMLWLRENASKDEAGNPRDVLPILVVAPKSVLDVWAGETVKFSPGLRVQVIRDKSELDTSRLGTDIDLLVMNYSQLRVNAEKLKPIEWLSVVLDEGQQIKNPDSIAARAARELKSTNRLVLSGTPIENRLLDVWSLMAFAMPGVLGNRKYFRDRFDRRKDAGAQIRLSARLRPFLLRRTKNQVALDLPSRTEEDMLSNLEEAQEELYNAELQKMQRLVLGFGSDAEVRQNSFAILQGLMRLRQICCHPGLADEQHMDKTSAKLNALFYLLDQLRESNHKVLVFSQFTSMLDIIKNRLVEEDRPHLLLTGQTKDRSEVVRTFHTSKDPHVFLLSLKAGGTGLNLTAASYVVLYDPWWNPAVEQQAIDRTHRIGQTNPVIAYRLLSRNTVEEKIRRLQAQKQQLVTGVLGDESFTSNLGLSDVRSLFQRDEEPVEEPRKARRIPRRSSRILKADGVF
jgi:hypothetical protein